MTSRVVITTSAGIAALGRDFSQMWHALLAGQSAIRSYREGEFAGHAVALLEPFVPRELLSERKLLKLLSRHDIFGLYAQSAVWQQSGWQDLCETADFADTTGIFCASPGAQFAQQDDFIPLIKQTQEDLAAFGRHLFSQVYPRWLLKILPNNVLAYTGILHRIQGRNENFIDYTVGGVAALAHAFHELRNQQLQRAVVVGYDAPVDILNLHYQRQLGRLSPTGLFPFCQRAAGTVLGEGAAAVTLETLESATARGATIIAEVLGVSTWFGEAAEYQVVRQLLEDSHSQASDIGLLCAHADGVRAADRVEAELLDEYFARTPVTHFKWALGHTQTASFLLDLGLTLQSLTQQAVIGPRYLKSTDEPWLAQMRAPPTVPSAPLALVLARNSITSAGGVLIAQY